MKGSLYGVLNVAEHGADPEQGLAMLPPMTTAGRQWLMGASRRADDSAARAYEAPRRVRAGGASGESRLLDAVPKLNSERSLARAGIAQELGSIGVQRIRKYHPFAGIHLA